VEAYTFPLLALSAIVSILDTSSSSFSFESSEIFTNEALALRSCMPAAKFEAPARRELYKACPVGPAFAAELAELGLSPAARDNFVRNVGLITRSRLVMLIHVAQRRQYSE
jgi:hypothetical protein